MTLCIANMSFQFASRVLWSGLGLLSRYLAGSPKTWKWQSQLIGGSGSSGRGERREAPAYLAAISESSAHRDVWKSFVLLQQICAGGSRMQCLASAAVDVDELPPKRAISRMTDITRRD